MAPTETVRSDFRQLILDNEDQVVKAYGPMKSRYTRMLNRIKQILYTWLTEYGITDMVTAQMYWDRFESELRSELSTEIELRFEDAKDILYKIFTTTYLWTLDYEDWEQDSEDESNLTPAIFLVLLGTAWSADELTYQERLNSNMEKAITQVRRIIMREIGIGSSSNKIWQSIYQELNKIKYRGSTQITDEAQHLSNEAVRMASTNRSNGYFINEILDNRICEFCRAMDGKYFKWDDYYTGITAPQFHPRCRGIIIPDSR